MSVVGKHVKSWYFIEKKTDDSEFRQQDSRFIEEVQKVDQLNCLRIQKELPSQIFTKRSYCSHPLCHNNVHLSLLHSIREDELGQGTNPDIMSSLFIYVGSHVIMSYYTAWLKNLLQVNWIKLVKYWHIGGTITWKTSSRKMANWIFTNSGTDFYSKTPHLCLRDDISQVTWTWFRASQRKIFPKSVKKPELVKVFRKNFKGKIKNANFYIEWY